MTAASPNYQKLAEMNRLPKDARDKIPYLAQLDTAEKKIKDLEEENARLRAGGGFDPKAPPAPGEDLGTTQLKCEVVGCDAMLGGRTEGIARNSLRLHMRTHGGAEPKAPPKV